MGMKEDLSLISASSNSVQLSDKYNYMLDQ